MRISISDIREAGDFAKRLERACDGILNGETRTEALGREGISLSMFLTLIRGLRRTAEGDPEAQSVQELKPMAWQDELMRDVTGDEYFYLPPDFEEALNDTMERVLDEDERRVISSLYPNRNTYDETAEASGMSVNTVRARQKSAIRKLREHQEEFVAGRKYLSHLTQIREKQAEYEQALDWMDDALDYLEELGADTEESVADQPVSPEALAFYRRNGLTTLADVVEHTLPELFTRVSDAAGEDGTQHLSAVRSGDFQIDSPLDETIGLDTKTANAFAAAGIHTVREFLALSEEEAFSIKGVGPRTIVYIYRRVLFG